MTISPARLRWLYLRGPLWWMGIITTVVGVVLLFIVITMWQGEERFAANAVRATATVTHTSTQTVMRGPRANTPTTVYLLHFTFQDESGRTHQSSTEVPINDWSISKKGDQLQIEYDRTDPSITRRPGSGTTVRWGLIAAGLGGVLFFTLGVSIVVTLLIRSGHRAQLVRTGTPALGVVDGVVENDAAVKLEGTYRVTYHFTDSEGTTRQGRGPAQSWSQASRFSAGDAVLVLHDPGNPARHEADVFEVRSQELSALQDGPNESAPVE